VTHSPPRYSGPHSVFHTRRRSYRIRVALVQSVPTKVSVGDVGVSKVVEVSLGDRSYPIYIGTGIIDDAELLQQHIPGKRVLLVTNATIAPLYLDR
jgi:hypothetical protein